MGSRATHETARHRSHRGSGGRRRRSPFEFALLLVCVVIGAVFAVPLVEIVRQVVDAGATSIREVLSGALLPTLFANSVKLVVVVSVGCGVMGLAAAWLVERTDVPAPRLLALLVLMPIAVPDDVAGYAWVSIAPSVQGFWGAAMVMTLVLTPLVFLPVAATLRRSDPALDEAARSLGASSWRRFVRVTLPGVRRPLVGGMLLVGLYLLGEYGAFAVLRYRTFATAIYTRYEIGFDSEAASVLIAVVCLMGVVLLAGESVTDRRRDPGRETRRPPHRQSLGRWRAPATVGLLAWCGLGLGVPVGSIVYWMFRGTSTTLPPASVLGVTVDTLVIGAIAALIATVLALPLAIMAQRRGGMLVGTVGRVVQLDRAVPALAIGLTLVSIGARQLRPVYQTTVMLEIAYVILFFPLALVAVGSAVARVPTRVDEAARSLGLSPMRVLRRVTVPLVAPGLGAAAILVWLSATTELTATLLLRPTGFETLATQFWVYVGGLAYGAAAPYAAIMIAVSVLPVLLLNWMTKQTSSSAGQVPRR